MKSAPTSRSVAALCGLALVAGCSCGGASFGGPPEGTPTELVPPAGPMTGILAKDLRVFLGVPYAAPPIGPNRFRPPVRAAHFDTPFDASKYGKVCPQLPRHDHGAPIEDDLEVEGDEDCLNLNVWAHADEKKRPVMVFIHGGGFQQGTGSKPYYEGSTLAREGDVVVVTINYRLGVLGLLASEELAAESPDHAAGNYAILDQIAALEWVRDNIEALGGDPKRVTIFGESAGATSVCVLTASPLARGLFHRAIVQSAAGCDDLPGLREASPRGRPSGVDRAKAIAEAAGCTGDVLRCLRERDYASLVRAAARAGEKGSGFHLIYTPVVDGRVLVEPVHDALRKAAGDVPMIIGSNADESSLFLLKGDDVPDAAAYEARVRAMFEDRAERVLAVYPPDQPGSPKNALARVVTEVVFTCPSLSLAAAAANGPEPAFAYWFDHQKSGRIGRKVGAFHGIEVGFLFGMLSERLRPTDDDLAVGRIMRTAWSSFAATGAPAATPAWPAYQATDPHVLRIAAEPEVIADPTHGRCAKLAAP